jgi:predicted aldo/keto reductase-like oxidoreductase
MPQALLKVLKTTDPSVALKAFENVEEDINEQMLWIDANLPFEYTKPEDLASAYDKLSRADVFLQTKFTYPHSQDSRLPYHLNARPAEQVRQSFMSSLEHLGVDYIFNSNMHEQFQDAWKYAAFVRDNWLVLRRQTQCLRFLCLPKDKCVSVFPISF